MRQYLNAEDDFVYVDVVCLSFSFYSSEPEQIRRSASPRSMLSGESAKGEVIRGTRQGTPNETSHDLGKQDEV